MPDASTPEKIIEKNSPDHLESARQSPKGSGIMGRPRKPPSIKFNSRTGRWRVLATVAGKQVKKIVRTHDEAKLIASQLTNAQHTDLHLLPTRLTPLELKEAEASKILLDDLGLGFLDGVKWLQANFIKQRDTTWKEAIEAYAQERKIAGISHFMVGRVASDAARLASFVGRPNLGNLTRAEVDAFLAKATEGLKPSSYNNLVSHIGIFCRWALKKKYLAVDPVEGIEKRRVPHSLPAVLTPAKATALIRDIEANAPEWLPYVTCCLFAAVRPCMRSGEAARLDAALRAGKTVFHADGLEIEGKTHSVRIIPWSMTGPLKTWLSTFPPKPGLWPCNSTANAEREWAKFRKAHNLTHDILRHTGISAMSAVNTSFIDVSCAAGNSEKMIKRHYKGRWTRGDTEILWNILPKNNSKPIP